MTDEISELASAILRAAEADDAAAVGSILDRDFPIETPLGEDGGTLLHNAAYSGAARTVRLLLDRGAQITARDRRWRSQPLEWGAIGSGEAPTTAREPDWPSVVRMLLDAGADTTEISTAADQPKPPSQAVADILRAAIGPPAG